jgi:hypothetical protein
LLANGIHSDFSTSLFLSKDVKIVIYKIILFPVILYLCESWFLTLREVHRRKVFEYRVLRGIFVRRENEIMGGWRNMCNEELHDCSANIIRIIKPRRIR